MAARPDLAELQGGASMLQRLIFSAAWLVLVSVASAKEKHEFSVTVKEGEIFAVEEQELFIESVDTKTHSSSIRDEHELTVVKAENGHAEQIDSRMTKRESDGLDLPAMVPDIWPPKETIRFEWIEQEYKPRLLKGELTHFVALVFKQGRWDPFLEGMLPSKPLAVGESERIEKPERLAVAGFPVGKLLSDRNETVVIDEPATIKLQKVENIDGSRIAYLTIGFKARELAKAADGEIAKAADGKPVSGTYRYGTTLLYDLDRKFITEAEVKLNVKAPAEMDGKNVHYSMDIMQVTRFEKQKPNP